MTKDLIRYDLQVLDALKGVIRKVLTDAVRDGLPGEHHFYISFNTQAPGVRMSQRLRDKYPEDMTIVLQHQFWDLAVTEHTFEVGLSFNGIPERLLVPFEAMTGFYDPSVQFGLKFELSPTSANPEMGDYVQMTTSEPQQDEGGRQPRGTVPTIVPAGKSKVPALKAAAPAPAKKGKDKDAKDPKDAKDADGKPAKESGKASKSDGDEVPPSGGGTVVSLDSFRKKSEPGRTS